MAINIEKTIKFTATLLLSGFNMFTNWVSTKVPNNIKAPLRRMVNNLNEQFNGLIRRTEELEEQPQKPTPALRRAQPIPKPRVRKTIKLTPFTEKNKNPKETSVLDGRLKNFEIDGENGIDAKSYFNKIKPQVINTIREEKKPSKVNFHFTCQFKNVSPETDITTFREAYFTSKPEIITASSNLSHIFDIITERLLEMISNFQKEKSR